MEILKNLFYLLLISSPIWALAAVWYFLFYQPKKQEEKEDKLYMEKRKSQIPVIGSKYYFKNDERIEFCPEKYDLEKGIVSGEIFLNVPSTDEINGWNTDDARWMKVYVVHPDGMRETLNYSASIFFEIKGLEAWERVITRTQIKSI